MQTIPFDPDVVKSNVLGLPLVEFSDGPASWAVKDVYRRLREILL